MKFKKILATVGSVLMLGATIAGSFAASYPAPFSSEGAVVVVGANAAATDMAAATDINSDLAENLAGSTSSVSVDESGDSYKFEKSSDKFDLSSSLNDFATSALDSDDLNTLLADGVYEDSENADFDYEQSLTVTDKSPTLIVDRGLNDKEPTLGFDYQDGDAVFTYTLEMKDMPALADMNGTTLSLVGNDYYVISAAADEIVLLDSANSASISEDGTPVTVVVDGKSYVVSVDFITEGEVKLNINGEVTPTLEEDDTRKLSDGAYVGIKDISVQDYAGGVKNVEFVIGQGKIALTDTDVELNGEAYDGLTSVITESGADLSTIAITWAVDGDTFLTEGTSMTMPLFGAISLVLGDINFLEAEETSFDAEEDVVTIMTEIKTGSLALPLFYRNAVNTSALALGADTDEILTTAAGGATFNLTLNVSEETYFVVTHVNAGGDEGESYAYQLTDIKENSDDEVVATLEGLAGETKIELTDLGDDQSIAGSEINLELVANSSLNTVTIQVSADDSGTVYANQIITAKGLRMMLPVASTASAALNFTDNSVGSFVMNLSEEDEDGNLAIGSSFTVTIAMDGTDGIHASTTSVTLQNTADDNKKSFGYVLSELATRVDKDTTGSLNELVVSYYGDEVTLDVSLASGVVEVTEVGTLVATDAETAKIAGKNLIVVGGSCINSVAANLLGGALCGADFTAATGVSAGQFLVQSFAREGKVALLVAGYDADDTTKAATYLVNNAVDTAVGAKEIKSSTVVASTA